MSPASRVRNIRSVAALLHSRLPQEGERCLCQPEAQPVCTQFEYSWSNGTSKTPELDVRWGPAFAHILTPNSVGINVLQAETSHFSLSREVTSSTELLTW